MSVVVHGYRHVLFLAGAAASWGIATVISNSAVDEIGPLTLLPIQLAVSVAALFVVTTSLGIGSTDRSSSPSWRGSSEYCSSW